MRKNDSVQTERTKLIRMVTEVRYLAKENFIGVRAVDIGSVEEGNATVDGIVDESDHVGFGLRRAVEGGHAHATQSLS